MSSLKTLLCGVGFVLAVPVGLSYIRQMSKNQSFESIQKPMEYVKTHNPNKYIETLEKDFMNEYKDYDMWKKAVKEVQDSLRIDSIAKTNYAKGAQMVRDSIAKTNLNDTVKTVMKSVK